MSKLDVNFLVNPFIYKKDKTILNSTQVEVDSFNFTILLTSLWRIVVRVSGIVSRPLILWMPSPKGFNPYKFWRKGQRIRSNMLFNLQCWKQMLHNHCKIKECSSCCTLKVLTIIVISKVVNGNGEGLFLRASLNLRVVASKVRYQGPKTRGGPPWSTARSMCESEKVHSKRECGVSHTKGHGSCVF